MTTTHTPGPWKIGHVHQSWLEIWGPDDPDGAHDIIGSAMEHPDMNANAALIAAAPDLLDACKTLADYVADLDGGNGRFFGIVTRARDAIAKAERTT